MKDKVYQAADAIAARGKKPTLELVRAEIGSGSFSTIGPLLKDWKADHPQAMAKRDADEAVPDTVAKLVDDLARRVWADAKAQASLGLDAVRRELEEVQADAAAEVDDLIGALKSVEAERDQIAGQVQAVTADLEEVRAELARVQTELRGQIEVRTKAESQTEAAKAMILSHEREMSGLYERLTATDNRLREMTDQKGKAEREAAKAQSELIAATARTGDLEAALAKAESRADRAEARADKAETKTEEVRAELDQVRDALATERAEHAAARQQIVTYEDRMERASADHVLAEEKAEALAAELAQIKKSEKG